MVLTVNTEEINKKQANGLTMLYPKVSSDVGRDQSIQSCLVEEFAFEDSEEIVFTLVKRVRAESRTQWSISKTNK